MWTVSCVQYAEMRWRADSLGDGKVPRGKGTLRAEKSDGCWESI